MRNLTKNEVQKASTFQLAVRYNYLIFIGETMLVEDITMADARELIWVEEELHRKVIKAVGHDFYPPDRVEEEKRAKPIKCEAKKIVLEPPLKQEAKNGVKINFRVVVTSSIGHKAAEFTVLADTRMEAEILAGKMIRKLGLVGAKYKIS